MMAQDTTVHVHGLVVEPWQVAVMLIGLALIQCGIFLWGVHVGREVATEPEVLPDVADDPEADETPTLGTGSEVQPPAVCTECDVTGVCRHTCYAHRPGCDGEVAP